MGEKLVGSAQEKIRLKKVITKMSIVREKPEMVGR